MKKIISCFLTGFLALSALPLNFVSAEIDNFEDVLEEKVYCEASIEQDFDDSSVLVIMDKSVGFINKTYDEEFFGDFPIESVVDLTAVEKNFRSLNIQEDTYRQILEIKLPEDNKENVLEVIEELEKIEGIKYAGPNYVGIPGVTPNDTSYSNQWALPKIKAPQAWDTTKGSKTVKVGILDTGISAHNDLNANMSTGLGWNFIDNNSNTSDYDSHGTHVAGIVGAVGNNNQGISGVCWNVSLVPLKFNGSVSQVSEALTYAMENDISIVNMSWWNFPDDPVLSQAIRNYTGLFVCIAGNAGTDIDNTKNYPASFKHSNMIVVGSSDSNDQKAGSSNYGVNTVDLFAPGDNIYSTVPNGYANFSGTSMAAPQVTGVAALIKARYPNAPASMIKNRIIGSVDRVSSLNEYCKTGGRLNAYKALQNTRISLEAPMNVSMTFNSQKTFHEFTAPKTDYYTFKTTSSNGVVSSENILYDSSGSRITGSGSTSYLQYKLNAGQKYYFESGMLYTFGKYILTIYDSTTANGAIRIGTNREYDVNISEAGQKRWYVYRPSMASHKYTIFSLNNGSSDPTGRLYESQNLSAPVLKEIAYNDDANAPDRNFSMTQSLLSGRDYYIEAGCYGNNTGSYNIRININVVYN